MESKASSGQILIECAVLLVFLAILFSSILNFDTPRDRKGQRMRGKPSRQEIIQSKQVLNFREFRNGDKPWAK